MATDSPGRVGDTRHDGPHQARQIRAFRRESEPHRCAMYIRRIRSGADTVRLRLRELDRIASDDLLRHPAVASSSWVLASVGSTSAGSGGAAWIGWTSS